MALFEDNPIRSAIHAFKYSNHKAVAPVLGKLLFNTFQQYNLTADVIVPVPLHPARFKERGYNQSELLANYLGQHLALPVDTSSLKRNKKTESQMTLNAAERRQNVTGAFNCNSQQLCDRHILLIDDVCTTGSTLDACAATLKSNGAASVWGLTLAKAR